MSNVRFFAAIALTDVVTAALVAALTLARPARADVLHPVECLMMPDPPTTPLTDISSWMNREVLRGYGNFSNTELHAGGLLLCAW